MSPNTIDLIRGDLVEIATALAVCCTKIEGIEEGMREMRRQVLHGNGQPSLAARVGAVERTCALCAGKEAGVEKAKAKIDLSWQAKATIFAALISSLTTFILVLLGG